MIKNLATGTEFFCMNGHSEPIHMVVKEGNDQFFACPKYMRKDEAHPDGREADERMCNNRISFTDAVDIMNKFSDMIEADAKMGILGQYAGMRFNVRRIKVTVLKYDMTDLWFGVVNERVTNE